MLFQANYRGITYICNFFSQSKHSAKITKHTFKVVSMFHVMQSSLRDILFRLELTVAKLPNFTEMNCNSYIIFKSKIYQNTWFLTLMHFVIDISLLHTEKWIKPYLEWVFMITHLCFVHTEFSNHWILTFTAEFSMG